MHPFKKGANRLQILQFSEQPNGFRVRVNDVRQKPMLDLAENLVRQGHIIKSDQIGDVAIYRKAGEA